ncbi:MAG TPA: hypothetical protein DEP72_06605 [Clostridiales bacterium]|nr:MAG: hypothetical protein A2Y18_03215 [Clostridiales bacterium GWD2_32_19]HCC07809.1 hypothetical protein [Clostridiales bacterium]
MKKKYINKTYLRGMEKYDIKLIKDEELNCYISLKKIDKVEEPLVMNHDGINVCVINDGYYIIEYVSIDDNYIVRTFFDKEQKVVEWYVDISKENGVSEDGIPFYYDLYLDILVFDEKVILIDEDDLKEALDEGKITQYDFDFAYEVGYKLIEQIKCKQNKYINRNNTDLKKMLKMINM